MIVNQLLPSTPHLTFFCSVACRSPIFVLSVPKRRYGSGFVRQSAIFTSVLIFQTSSFFTGHKLMDMMILHLNMLHLCTVDGIVDEVYCAL